MTRFPTAGHLVSWARLSPRTIQSGAKNRPGKTGKGNPYLKGILGEAAAAAARTDTFLGERYRLLVKRIGKLKALVAGEQRHQFVRRFHYGVVKLLALRARSENTSGGVATYVAPAGLGADHSPDHNSPRQFAMFSDLG
jgi:Transposase IS116/IS110/IS902 family